MKENDELYDTLKTVLRVQEVMQEQLDTLYIVLKALQEEQELIFNRLNALDELSLDMKRLRNDQFLTMKYLKDLKKDERK
jgi:hypothetical protein